MKKIPPNRGVAIIDDSYYDIVTAIKWHLEGGYAVSNTNGVAMHRLILSPSEGMEVDHINRDRLDNRRCNLRECTRAENSRNLPPQKGCASRYKGVTYHKASGSWHACIQRDNVNYSLKYHKTEALAAAAYDSASRDIHGEFGSPNDERLNIIDFSVPDATDIYDYERIQQCRLSESPPLDMLINDELRRSLGVAISTLSAREQAVINLRFIPDDARVRTLAELGSTFKVTRECVRQIERRALNKIKNLLIAQSSNIT